MKVTCSLLGALSLVALCGAPAFAQGQASELDRALAGMKTASGDDYVAARGKTVALGDAAKTTLEGRLASATWTDATWTDLAIATIAHAHLAHPEVVQRVNHLEGLDPAHYLARRRPEAECGRELKQLGPDAAGALLELFLKTFESYPFTTAASLPPRAKGSNPADLAAQERIALREGIVYALAEARHPAAFFVCRQVARDATESEAARLQAAEGLGTVASSGSLTELTSLHDDAATPAPVKLAAIRGAARVPTADALAFLSARLVDAASPDERRQAAFALGAFGSVHGWAARGPALQKTGNDLRLRAATKLVDAVRSGQPDVPGDALVDALGTIAHPDSAALLGQVASDASVPADRRALAERALERVKMAVARSSK